MKILVIGNGFDLAHELPTKYMDFLKFIYKIKIINTWHGDLNSYKRVQFDEDKDTNKLSEFVKSYIVSAFAKRDNPDAILQELISLSANNFWIEYFSDKKNYKFDGWIDFESEISQVIQYLDEYNKTQLSGTFIETQDVRNETNEIINLIVKLIYRDTSTHKTDFNSLKNRLLCDLNSLIRCLEIYLHDCLGKYEINCISPDIKDIDFDKVLSFNYTDTYKKTYSPFNESIDYDFIHGKTDSLRNIVANNMVLGIDEYLVGESKNKDTTFIEFKKFYQRIHKQTGCHYNDWINEIKKLGSEHDVYIFGHSLDITDKDVLKDLIDNDNVKTTIFYLNKDVYGKQIANLVKVLGQDNLIAKVSGSKKSIEFKEQISMLPLKETDFEILRDINSLYTLYTLTDANAKNLTRKIIANIENKNISYFKTQHNVISIYEALIELDYNDTELVFKLLKIAEELSQFNEDFTIEQFDSDEWGFTNIAGEYYCDERVINFINLINRNNKSKSKKMYESTIIDMSKSANLEFLNLIPYDIAINNIDDLSKMMDILFSKFSESNVQIELMWNYIDKIIYITDEAIFKQYIETKLIETKDIILTSRLKYIKFKFDKIRTSNI